MVGVGEDDFGVEIIDEIARGKTFDGACVPTGMKKRGFRWCREQCGGGRRGHQCQGRWLGFRNGGRTRIRITKACGLGPADDTITTDWSSLVASDFTKKSQASQSVKSSEGAGVVRHRCVYWRITVEWRLSTVSCDGGSLSNAPTLGVR